MFKNFAQRGLGFPLIALSSVFCGYIFVYIRLVAGIGAIDPGNPEAFRLMQREVFESLNWLLVSSFVVPVVSFFLFKLILPKGERSLFIIED